MAGGGLTMNSIIKYYVHSEYVRIFPQQQRHIMILTHAKEKKKQKIYNSQTIDIV